VALKSKNNLLNIEFNKLEIVEAEVARTQNESRTGRDDLHQVSMDDL